MIFVSTILSVQAKLFELFKNKMFNLDLIYAKYFVVSSCLYLLNRKMNPKWPELDFVNATVVIKTQA